STVSASYSVFQAEDGIRARNVTGVQTCALPITSRRFSCHQYYDPYFARFILLKSNKLNARIAFIRIRASKSFPNFYLHLRYVKFSKGLYFLSYDVVY